jgi:hypothetical protein
MQDDAYTFLGASIAGATLFMDIGIFDSDDGARRHALVLLGQHQSADLVEVWRAASLIGQIPRQAPKGLAPVASP